ncbi:hypothetical protein [Streptomyces omiyaensis]|uniref:Uncharacterized protein n=1 Tax=Streptomyces omiyaensis TaxID=68247 RepID=A0ABW7BV62_9ACTN
MTDRRHSEEERIHRLLAVAAERPDSPAAPGADFTARARRSLARRRLGAVAGAVVVCAGAAGAVSVLRDAPAHGEEVPVASAECLRSTAERLGEAGRRGFGLVQGELRAGAIDTSDGITEGSTFRFEITGTVVQAGGIPSSGPVLTWYEALESQHPDPGRYVLLLSEAESLATDGTPLYLYDPHEILPVAPDGRVLLPCGDGGTASVGMEQLRTAVTDAKSLAGKGNSG